MPYVTPPVVEARKRRMRSRILDVAAELFAELGYETTTVQQIVQRAETSVGNCYFYFKDKAAILYGVVRRLCRRADLWITRAMKPHTDPARRMAVTLYAGCLLMVQHRDLARILFLEAPRTDSRVEVARFLRRRVDAFMTSLQAAAVNRGREDSNRSAGFERILERIHDQPLNFVAIAWTGAAWGAFEALARSELEMEASALGRHLLRWNFQGLGLPPSEVDKIIADIELAGLPSGDIDRAFLEQDRVTE